MMLHGFYRDFLGLKEIVSRTVAEQAMLERLTAGRGTRGCAEHLTDAFVQSEACASCGLAGGGVAEFTDWRAIALRRLAVQDAVIGCWVGVMSAPFDWARIRQQSSCLCPFVVPCGDGLMWRPAAVEATCLLLAQSCSVGVDLHLRVRGELVPCHSFLLGPFREVYRAGGLPAGILRREAGRLILELDAKRYPWEVVQFFFYYAYGYVICLGDGGRAPSSGDLAMLQTVASHLICDTGSLCRHLVDASGLVTNVIVLLDRLVRQLRPLDTESPHLVTDLLALFRVSRLFDDLRRRLMDKVRAEVQRQLTGGSNFDAVGDVADRKLSSLHHCRESADRNGNFDCLIFDLAVDSFRQLVLQSETGSLDSSLQPYLASLVSLYETNRCDAMVKACRDMRYISGILCLIGAPCSANLASLHSLLVHLCHTLMLLVCDQAVLSFADALCSSGDSLVAAAVEFQVVAAFSHPVMAALDRLNESQEPQQLSDGLLHALRVDLNRPEMSAMVELQHARRGWEEARTRLAVVGPRELRRVAYASYTAGRLPRMKFLVQALALLLTEADEAAAATFADDAATHLSSEGRRILCSTEGSLARLLGDFRPELAMARLRALPDAAWERLEELSVRPADCSGGGAAQCPAHGECGEAACLLHAWVGAAVRGVCLHRRGLQAVATDASASSGILPVCRFAADHRDCFLRQADELLASGELEPDRHAALTAALLPDGPDTSTASPAVGSEEGGEVSSKTSFVMRLLPSLQFQFEPRGCPSNCH